MTKIKDTGRERWRHGMHRSPTYNVWVGMKNRCFNKNNPAYSRYGGRGISVCERWLFFLNFLADMGEKPDDLSLERTDNDKGYSPENCVWANRTTQGRNKRNNHLLEYNGESMPVSAWAERYGLKNFTLLARLRKGWTTEAALTLPLITKRAGIARGMPIHMAYGDQHNVHFKGDDILEESYGRTNR